MPRSANIAARLLEADPAEDQWTFSVRVSNNSIEVENHDEAGAYRDASAEITIQWQADFDVRGWGIKEILPIIKSVTGQVVITDPDTDREERIPISWPKSATASQVRSVMGRQAPPPEASAKDWIDYYGQAQGDWTVDTEQFRTAGQHGISLTVTHVRIDVRDRHITVQF